MMRMSTGHMEGDLQPLYLLLTDCYIYLLRKGKWLTLAFLVIRGGTVPVISWDILTLILGVTIHFYTGEASVHLWISSPSPLKNKVWPWLCKLTVSTCTCNPKSLCFWKIPAEFLPLYWPIRSTQCSRKSGTNWSCYSVGKKPHQLALHCMFWLYFCCPPQVQQRSPTQ